MQNSLTAEFCKLKFRKKVILGNVPIRAPILGLLSAALLPKPNVAAKQLALWSTLTIRFEQQWRKLQRADLISREARLHNRLLI